MSPRTRLQTGTGSSSDGACPSIVVRAAVVGACLLLTGCGQSVRDEHARVRGVVIEAKPGDGNLIASALWTGENVASEDRQSRVASVETPGNSAHE